MMITDEEIRRLALKVVSENQRMISTDAGKKNLTYTVAYNDGVLDMMNAILKEGGKKI